MTYHPSWPEQAQEVFEKCVAAHGGWDAWNDFDSIEFEIEQFGGMIPVLKGIGGLLERLQKIKVQPHKRRVDFYYMDHMDTFENGKLIYSSEGKVIEEGRAIFRRGHFEQWEAQHALYFFGYAFSNYFGYPFILKDHKMTWFEEKPDLYFEIEFEDGFDTHSKKQIFWFDETYILYRHDYTADVAGSLLVGSHFTSDYRSFNGIKVSRLRRVKPRLWKQVLPGNALSAQLKFMS